MIFGALGDLTHRLLLPALRNLAADNLLSDSFAVLGIARTPLSVDEFRGRVRDALAEAATPSAQAATEWLLERLYYLEGDFDDPATYRKLQDELTKLKRTRGASRNYLFYLATPPTEFPVIARHLCNVGLTHEEEGWRRVIVEKPFGTDLESARALNRQLLACMAERQIYRIDHYLGKETVQNIMVLRFANGLFEPLWNRDHIDHVQITVAETVTVGHRGRFYDATGALRDMVPNHLFQLLALTAMEPPSCFSADAVRAEKTKVLDAVSRRQGDAALANIVRGQYAAGKLNGAEISAYREEKNVRGDSNTETFIAMRLAVENWRWAGVPFYLRTGKALAARKTEIAIQFKRAPLAIFRDTPIERLAHNFLVLHIQPDEGVTLEFNAKVPSPLLRIEGVSMAMSYKDYFDAAPKTGYETLIYDSMIGDATLFQRDDNVEAAWRVVQPLLDAWQGTDGRSVFMYPSGSRGPAQADELLERDGRQWRPIA
ncbi:MAG TPA: glucose-6-phosphate dehydrogenase [Burkholderiales bacterium]|nr:glucose-6-phosphate dehydrogenase [Burkholderiales bacterium]